MANINLDRVGWQDGTLISKAKVEIDGTIYDVEPEQYSGQTPLSSANLKKMEDNTEKAINEVNTNLNDKINGTVLYNNSSGTSANITFTNNITTYKRLMIEYFDESSKSICISNVPVVLNRVFTLMNFYEGTDNNYLFVAKIKLESNKLVWNSNLRYFLNSGMPETNRKMFISKITGYTY